MSENIAFVSIGEYLNYDLGIPEYQRPYRWHEESITRLFFDCKANFEKDAKADVFLGAVILHHEEGSSIYHIVDGQQRTISLLLLLKALDDHNVDKSLSLSVEPSSKDTIIKNFKRLKSLIAQSPIQDLKGFTQFICEQLKVCVIKTNSLNNAFLLFERQNARKKELLPEDILKALHLGEIPSGDEDPQKGPQENKPKTWTTQKDFAQFWEKLEGKNPFSKESKITLAPEHLGHNLSALFRDILFPIRYYSLKSQRFSQPYYWPQFEKKDIDTLFKGNDPHSVRTPLGARISALYEKHAEDWKCDEPAKAVNYFLAFDDPLINGENFFVMLNHYAHFVAKFEKEFAEKVETLDCAPFNLSKSTLDKYLNPLFRALICAIADKFGFQAALELHHPLVVLVYSLRLRSRVTARQTHRVALILFGELRGMQQASELQTFRLMAQDIEDHIVSQYRNEANKTITLFQSQELTFELCAELVRGSKSTSKRWESLRNYLEDCLNGKTESESKTFTEAFIKSLSSY